MNDKLKKFFEGVEKASNTLDLDLIGSQYADQFIFADPNGARVVEKQKFLPFLPKRREFFKALGHQSTKVLSLEETLIDNQYTMVKAHFLLQFQKIAGEIKEINLDSTYILFTKWDAPKIVMHIEPEDVQQAMKDRGLL
jgi:hypothetical protein